MAKILLVEDDQLAIKAMQLELTNAGYDLHVVSDGQAAFGKASELKPDLILLDVILPGLDGFGILKKLKADLQTKNIPVIILTNLDQDGERERGLDLGAVDYLVKTKNSLAEIVSKIKKFI